MEIQVMKVILLIKRWDNRHSASNQLCAYYIYDAQHYSSHIVPVQHHEKLKNHTDIVPLQTIEQAFVCDKKQYLHYISPYNLDTIYDINIANVLFNLNIPQFNSILYRSHLYIMFYNRLKVHNAIDYIPILKIKQICDLYINNYILNNINNININNQEFIIYNNIATQIFYNIQKNGIAINRDKFIQHFSQLQYLITNNKIYSNYNLNTMTGRPSNAFGINFAALNKQNGQRQAIISSFENGILLQLDFSGYHLALISQIIQYQFQHKCNIHNQLAKKYFNCQSPTPQQISASKQISFKLLYGGISKQYHYIQFFKLVQQYINNIWNIYNNNKQYIPIVNRYIGVVSKKQTLFNYLIQNYQTKNNLHILEIILTKLKDKGLKSKMILYTYDSFLFDIESNQLKDAFTIINNTLNNQYRYAVHYSVGKNYGNMKKI